MTTSADVTFVRDKSADGAGVGVGVWVGIIEPDGAGDGVPGPGDAVGDGTAVGGPGVAPGMTAVSCKAQLLFTLDSVDEVETQTVFVTLAGPLWLTLTITEMDALSPGPRLPSAQVAPVHAPWLDVAIISKRPAGSESLTITESAADSPSFVTAMK